VVESGKQGHGETWNRLHRKMKVNSYLMLRPDQFDAAVNYLQGKFDDTSIATLIQKHLPNAIAAIPMKNALQALPAPTSITNMRWLTSFSPIDKREIVQPVPVNASIIDGNDPSDVHTFIDEIIPLALMPKVIDSANIRIGRYLAGLRSLPPGTKLEAIV
jgi:hypothetical protein